MVQPILKWAGGKRWLINSPQFSAPSGFGRYIEPFVGSAALFFHLEPARAILGDVNAGLINFYNQIKSNPRELFAMMVAHQARHSRDYYYAVRELDISSGISGASNFLYLNRSCWNGLFRVNLKGKFNVPIGTKDKIIMDSDDFVESSRILQGADIKCCDFEEVIDQGGSGDFIFIDPPYTVKHNFNGFVKYNEDIFKWSDQIRLRDCVVRARNRGAIIAVTNADHPSVHELYSDGFFYSAIARHSVLAGSSGFRRKTTEAVFTNAANLFRPIASSITTSGMTFGEGHVLDFRSER